MRFHINPDAGTVAPSPFKSAIGVGIGRQVSVLASDCPRHAVTPLRRLADFAADAQVSAIYYKDESRRFGLSSFKALGGVYAVGQQVARRLSERLGHPVDFAALARGEFRNETRSIVVACATDGNHGRGVAAGARHFGCRAMVFLHENVSLGRELAIKSYGAEIVRTKGDYDDSVRAAARAAHEHGYELISDTSEDLSDAAVLDVMRGYTVIGEEILAQLHAAGSPLPTHLFVQAGVGGLAGSMAAYFWDALGAQAPKIVIVEPERADCLLQSGIQGRAAMASGNLDTIMAGLSCGEPSALAWEILRRSASAFVTIPDDLALAAMRRLASGCANRPAIVAGESAVAGLAGLMEVAKNSELREAIRLNGSSRVLVIGTEGATDPAIYREIVGRDASEVAP